MTATHYPIFIPHGGGGEMTEADVLIFKSIWITLNLIWIISIIVALLMAYVSYKREKSKNSVLFRRKYWCHIKDVFSDYFYFWILNPVMICLWVFFVIGLMCYGVYYYLYL